MRNRKKHNATWRVSGRFIFFNDTATTEIYTLSLHDALPIFGAMTTRVGVLAEFIDLEPVVEDFESAVVAGLAQKIGRAHV